MRWGLTLIGVWIWVAGILALLLWFHPGQAPQLEGALYITKAELCEGPNCTKATPVTLPYFSKKHLSTTPETRWLRFRFGGIVNPERQPAAVYFPKFAESFNLWLNDTQFISDGAAQGRLPRLWNRPRMVPVPATMIRPEGNTILMSLTGLPVDGLELSPFFIGPRMIVEPAYEKRFMQSKGAALFGLGLLVIVGLLLSGVWFWQRDAIYGWLALSSFAACLIQAVFAFDAGGLPYRVYIFWGWFPALYVYLILRFINQLIDLRQKWLVRAAGGFVAATSLLIFVLPENLLFLTYLSVSASAALFSTVMLANFWIYRKAIPCIDFSILFLVISISVAISAYEVGILALPNPSYDLHLLHYMPLVMTGAGLWVISANLVRSRRDLGALNLTLKQQVKDRTAKLEETYQRLAIAERRKAVDGERERIMLDLHDGVGGQLVNSIAYMENHNIGDETLKTALEDALRDLALMLDSLESGESVGTLLGMLRSRLEALLARHNLEFIWKIEDEPALPKSGASQNLMLVRIVQEAITNTIKHGQANTIIIAADSTSVRVEDDGKGFDMQTVTMGHGLLNMQQRAEQLEAELSLTSSKSGTKIALIWHPVANTKVLPQSGGI